MIYALNAALSGLALLLLSFALRADWANMRAPWRWVLVAGVAQQAVLTYVCLEAARQGLDAFVGTYLFLLAVGGLVFAGLIAVIRTRDDYLSPDRSHSSTIAG